MEHSLTLWLLSLCSGVSGSVSTQIKPTNNKHTLTVAWRFVCMADGRNSGQLPPLRRGETFFLAPDSCTALYGRLRQPGIKTVVTPRDFQLHVYTPIVSVSRCRSVVENKAKKNSKSFVSFLLSVNQLLFTKYTILESTHEVQTSATS